MSHRVKMQKPVILYHQMFLKAIQISFLHIKTDRVKHFNSYLIFLFQPLLGWYALLSFIRLVPRIVVGMDLLPRDKIPMQSHMENCLLLQTTVYYNDHIDLVLNFLFTFSKVGIKRHVPGSN